MSRLQQHTSAQPHMPGVVPAVVTAPPMTVPPSIPATLAPVFVAELHTASSAIDKRLFVWFLDPRKHLFHMEIELHSPADIRHVPAQVSRPQVTTQHTQVAMTTQPLYVQTEPPQRTNVHVHPTAALPVYQVAASAHMPTPVQSVLQPVSPPRIVTTGTHTPAVTTYNTNGIYSTIPACVAVSNMAHDYGVSSFGYTQPVVEQLAHRDTVSPTKPRNTASPTNVRPGYQRNLPKWKMDEYGGEPLKWPRWSAQFIATIDSADISPDEKLNYLNQLCTGKARDAIDTMMHGGADYYDVWACLERKFGQPQVVVNASLGQLIQHPALKMHNSNDIVEFARVVGGLVYVLRNHNYEADLASAANLAMAVQKLPPNMRESWARNIVREKLERPSLAEFHAWLQAEADTHELMQSSLGILPTQSKPKPQIDNGKPKPTVKTFAVEGSKASPKPETSRPLCCMCKKPHPLYKCEEFAKLSPTERAQTAKDHGQCFACLSGDHQSRTCPRARECGVDGCKFKTHNRLIHGAERVYAKRKGQPDQSEVKQPSGKSGSALSNTSTSDAEESTSSLKAHVKGLLQVVEVKLSGPSSEMKTFALCDSGEYALLARRCRRYFSWPQVGKVGGNPGDWTSRREDHHHSASVCCGLACSG